MNQRLLLPVFAATLFTSALLLFSVQPMASKMLLPMLGGSPSVWNTAMVFFQIMLLMGYGYAHLSAKFLPFRIQAILHIVLMFAFLATRPLFLSEDAAPPEGSGQSWWQLTTMLMFIGGPFFILAGSAPLFQHWFSSSNHKDAGSPYFLYAVSNAGSMAALLLYPVLFEPMLTLTLQKVSWLSGYHLLMLLAGLCALFVYLNKGTQPSTKNEDDNDLGSVTWGERISWIILSFVPSSLMLGLTTYVTTDLASVPMLWVIPLALYLLTFIIAFAKKPLISMSVLRYVTPYMMVLIAGYFIAIHAGASRPWMILLHVAVFFTAGLLCHMELSRLKPAPKHLTEFYLLMSFGGVLGGTFNALLAPLLFPLPFEYCLTLCTVGFILWAFSPQRSFVSAKEKQKYYTINIAVLVAAAGLAWLALYTAQYNESLIASLVIVYLLIFSATRRGLFAFLCAAILIAFQPNFLRQENDTIYTERNYFGIIKVAQDGVSKFFYHGTTLHGAQFKDSLTPVSYYSPPGPAGDIFRNFDRSAGEQRVAALGLGVGSIACFKKENRHFDFYEIDEAVVKVAQNSDYFTFLNKCQSPYNVVLGDARLRIAQTQPSTYDLIFVDTFSSDNIPVHIMTKEAIETYLRKLKPGGIIAVNISNRYLDLTFPLGAIAHEMGLSVRSRFNTPEREKNTASTLFEASHYVVIARNDDDLAYFTEEKEWNKLKETDYKAWTDDYVNILSSMYIFNGR